MCIDLFSDHLSCSLSWDSFYHVSQTCFFFSFFFFTQPFLLSEPIFCTHYSVLFPPVLSYSKICPFLYCEGKSMSLDGLLLFAGGNGMSDIPARGKKWLKCSASQDPLVHLWTHHFLQILYILLSTWKAQAHPFSCCHTVAARKVLSLLTC